jgi:hypothetical protein
MAIFISVTPLQLLLIVYMLPSRILVLAKLNQSVLQFKNKLIKYDSFFFIKSSFKVYILQFENLCTILENIH